MVKKKDKKGDGASVILGNTNDNVVNINEGTFKQLVANNDMLNRLELAARTGKTFGGKRDLYKVLGYKPITELRNEDYVGKYLRQDIAQRIVHAYPDAVWTRFPSVQEDDDTQNETAFEMEFDNLAKRLRLFHYLNRADRIAGLGQYSVLLLGVADGMDLTEPLMNVSGPEAVIYLMPFSEYNAQIQKYDENPASERFGLPEIYALMTGGYAGKNSSQMPTKTIYCHHSRLIHLAEGTLENDVFGLPRLQPIFNRLEDLEKVVGGAAEIYWINGRGGLSFNLDKEVQLQPDAKEEFDKATESYVHQLSRTLRTQGMEVQPLHLPVEGPAEHVEAIMDLISGTTGIPKRILVGSERGELASSQDENNWLTRIEERRDTYCEPLILRPLIDKLMMIGALPMVEEYTVEWPKLSSASETDKAEIMLKKSQAIRAYTDAQGADMLVPPEQYVEEVLGMDYREDDIKDWLDSEGKKMMEDLAEMEGQRDVAEKAAGKATEKARMTDAN